jgi:hypothetical protein
MSVQETKSWVAAMGRFQPVAGLSLTLCAVGGFLLSGVSFDRFYISAYDLPPQRVLASGAWMFLTVGYVAASVFVILWGIRRLRMVRSKSKWPVAVVASSLMLFSALVFCAMFSVHWLTLSLVTAITAAFFAQRMAFVIVVYLAGLILPQIYVERVADVTVWLSVGALAVLSEVLLPRIAKAVRRQEATVPNAASSPRPIAALPEVVRLSTILLGAVAFSAPVVTLLSYQFMISPQTVGGGRPILVAQRNIRPIASGVEADATCAGPQFWARYLDACSFATPADERASCRRVYLVMRRESEVVIGVQETAFSCDEQPDHVLFSRPWCTVHLKSSELPTEQVYQVRNGRTQPCSS